ncbi:MAG: chemotaxis protein CheC [Methanosarcinaceae archaeon]|nr:chemotaxis protein CheC [Methanosarcinaceae archaeon]
MTKDIDHLTEFQYGALEEIGNIGMENAVTSLSKMLNHDIKVNIPKLNLEKIENVPQHVGGAETIVLGLLVRMEGDLQGYVVMLFPIDSAKTICQIITGEEDVDLTDDMNSSLMNEIANILAGTYVRSLADFLKVSLTISTPYSIHDMTGAILDQILVEMSQQVEHSLLLDTEFIVEDNRINGSILTLYDTQSLELLIQRIDEMTGSGV